MYKSNLLLLAILMTSLSSHASYKVYEAEISDSSWQFSGNPLQCNLSHSVPEYGKGSFFKGAGKNQQLKFSMGYKRQPVAAVKVASVQSMSPSWFPKQSAKLLGELKILNGKSIFQTENTASWKLLSELETGRFPMFRYQEFASLEDQVSVSLSAVGFKNPYNQFLDCLNTLVPYKLEELKKMTLRFDFAKDKVKPPYREKLRALAQYIRHDSELEVVFISGHTDSKGSRNYNHKLSERRIASVQQILTLPGTDSNRFNSLAHGERKPVASNRKSSGRALNRRVYIRVE